ncbi:hypothetical protein BBK82_03550 [Lentzea guizhouensis]|uniref:Uncharacterized protein n=1 Tax=Lentzea guizhouensis TaxID=1586287 RepID=A0A1B2HC37_9PSEU|nr:hypothetical protein [Lentzea guizhouensis]ANZ35291.1 hypothetical protein BBK82_03550 [Lentzea guizhouensis]
MDENFPTAKIADALGGKTQTLANQNSVQREVGELRQAVEDLAHRVNADPAGRKPDRSWCEPVSNLVYGEWDVARDRANIRVRAGHTDGVPGLFIVDRASWDMTHLSVADAYDLIAALVGGIAYLRDDLTELRARKERR